jgi:hypothetical protein
MLMSGRSPLFLPEYIVRVNISANYSRIRVTLSATSPSLSFAPHRNFSSSIDVTPKCAIGSFVSPSYECVKCSNGTFSSHVDSQTCRFENFKPFCQFFLQFSCALKVSLVLNSFFCAVFALRAASRTNLRPAARSVRATHTSLKMLTFFAEPVQSGFSHLSDTILATPLIF